MQKFNGSLIRQFQSLTTGNAASGVQVSVFISGTNTLATLYATNNTAGAQLSNPLTTDDKGFYSFYAADGRYRLQFNNGYPALEEQLVDVIDINAEVDSAIADIDAALVVLENTVDTLTIVVAGDFETGTTVTARNQVVLWPISAGGDGREYRWAGALPKTVPAASTPASTGGISDSAWVYTADVALEQKLIAGDVPIKNPNGTAAAPSVTFKDDSDTGMFRKAANSLALSTGGVERVTITQSGLVGIDQPAPTAKLHVEVDNDISAGIRSKATWQGSTGNNYQNNDVIFTETYNDILSNSENWSWAISSSNAYNNIPAGVTDSGFRVGVLGWAVSVNVPGYTHAGTLSNQYGVIGRAGYQGGGSLESPSGSVVTNAYGVKGHVINDSPLASITNAYAGRFEAFEYSGAVSNNYAVYARAANGSSANWAFYGAEGGLFNFGKAYFNSTYSDIDSRVSCRVPINAFEFGFPDAGYGSALGATQSQGFPFLSFCCEADATGDTFKTQGKQGHVIDNDLSGALRFSVVPSVSASGQTPVEAMRVTPTAGVVFANRITIPSAAPATAASAGTAGNVTWDADYIYICVAANTWKRVAIATW